MQCQSLLSLNQFHQQIEQSLEQTIESGHDNENNQIFINNIQLGSRGIALLINISPVLEMKQLLLWDNAIGDAGVSILSKVNWSNLQTLRLAQNNITNKGIKFLTNGNFSSISQLSLHGNPIGSEGIKQIVKGHWKNLSTLLLSQCQIGNQGAFLLTLGNWKSLRSINLGSNALSQISSLVLYNMKNEIKTSFSVTLFGNKFRISISKLLKKTRPQTWKISA